MPDGGAFEYALAQFIEYAYVAFEAVAEYAVYVEAALVVAASYQSYESGVRARNAYNASLRDRYVMQRTAVGQRALVLGRARVSGPIAFMQSYGTNQSTLAIVIVLAAHECDAIESIYFNDQKVVVDIAGNVTGILSTEHFSVNSSAPLTVFLAVPAQATTITATATYAGSVVTLSTSLAGDNLHLTLSGARATGVGDVKVTYQPITCQYTPAQMLDQVVSVAATAASGSYTFPVGTTTYGPYVGRTGFRSQYVGGAVAGTSVVVVQTLAGKQTALASTPALDSTGNATAVSWTGATVGATVQITSQGQYNASRARIRQYLGAAGQVADPTLISNLPGEWTTSHLGSGLCYLVCEFDYDQSSFSAGLPNVSAVLRGAKLVDPRGPGVAAWTENPAVMARGYWTHPLGGNFSAATVDDSSIIAAANVCDPSMPYFVGPFNRTAPRFTAAYVASKDMKPQDVLTDLTMAMGGRWVISGNLLRVKAGAYSPPVAAIDASWLTGESSVTLQPLPARQGLFNSVQGNFCDETNDYRAVLYPKQVATALVTSDGRELPLDITYTAVTKTAQAQYLSACAIRYNRAGMTVRLACNLRAFPLEVFDVVSLTLSRFGFAAQVFEVTDTAFTPDGLVTLTLKFTDPSIYALDASYQLTAYAPKTTFPQPWNVQVPILGVPITGPSVLLAQADGTVVSRIYVIISMSDVSVITGGYIDVAYIDAADTTGNWSLEALSGDAQGVYLAPVKDGHTYQIKARARNTLFTSAWCASVSCLVIGATAAPGAVAGLTVSNAGGTVYFNWMPNTDPDYKQTVIQRGPQGTTGNTWGAGNMYQIFAGAASTFGWPSPGIGVYEVQVRHYNWSGNPTASATISVTTPDRMERILAGVGSTATWGGVTGAGKPSDNATTDLVLVARGQCVVTGNTGSKPTGVSGWDSDIYSADSYTGGAYASAVASTVGLGVMFGLNSDPTTDASYTSLDYAWYVGGTLGIYESGTLVLSGVPITAGDVLVVLYDGVHVSYYQNGALARVVSAAAGLKLFWDSSYADPGAILNNIRFGPQTSIGGIVMSANGTLGGAGGGAVTISGLGTTGAGGSGNLLTNGDFSVASNGLPTPSWGYYCTGNATVGSVTAGGPVGQSSYWRMQNQGTAAPIPYGVSQGGFFSTGLMGGIQANTNYVVSFYVRTSATGLGVSLNFDYGPATATALQAPPLGSGWTRYVWLLNWGSQQLSPNIYFGTNAAFPANQWVDYACFQMEQGDAPSGWAPAAFIDGNGALRGTAVGAGTTVANSLLTAPIAAAATTANWGSVSSTPANLSALSGSEVINNTGISINGSGQLMGIGVGAGAAVANSLLTASIADKLSASAGGVLAATVSLGSTAGAGFVAGTLTWNAAGARTGGYGVALTPGGLVGYNSSGAPTFSISASTGAAYFGGMLALGTASAGTASGSVASTAGNASGTSSINTGGLTILNYTASGGDVLVAFDINVVVMTNTNTPCRVVLTPMIGGAIYTPASHSPEVEVSLAQSYTMALAAGTGATGYNWGTTVNFSSTIVVPAASFGTGSKMIGFYVTATFYNGSGGGNVVTGSSIYTEAVATVREFKA